MKLQEYINQMKQCSGRHLISTDGIYSGKGGHLRFAREVGAAIPDFKEQEQKDFSSVTYGGLYVISCNLKPLLSMSEWHKELEKGKQKMLEIKADMKQKITKNN